MEKIKTKKTIKNAFKISESKIAKKIGITASGAFVGAILGGVTTPIVSTMFEGASPALTIGIGACLGGAISIVECGVKKRNKNEVEQEV